MELATEVALLPFLDHQGEEGYSEYQAYADDATFGQVQEITDTALGIRKGPKMYKMLGTKAGVLNGNDRIYPGPVLSSMVKQWKKNNPDGAIGEEGHPPSYQKTDGTLGWRSKTENKCIKVVDVHEPDEAGNVYFVFHTIDTQRGRDLQAVLDAGGKIGCSMRAAGKGKPAKFKSRDVQIATYLDLTVFDVLDNPALSDTLGSAVPITDSQLDGMLKDAGGEHVQEYSDAVDPFLQRIKASQTYPDLMRLKVEADQTELDSVDRVAFNNAYYERYYQISNLERADRMEKSGNRIGFNDGQEENEEESDLKYKFEDLVKMTDTELNRIKQETPEVAPMCDAIIGQRENEAKTQRLADIEKENNERRAREEAQAFMDSQEVQSMLSRLPTKAQKVVRERVDLTSKEKAEQSFTDAFELAAQFSADDKLRSLGFDRNKPITDSLTATTNLEIGETAQPWREITDKLGEVVGAMRKRNGNDDENTKKMNADLVQSVLDEIDTANESALMTFADDASTATSLSTVQNGIIFYRTLIEQVFQTMVAMSLVDVTTFQGQFASIPREEYKRSNNTSTRPGEFKRMARGKLSVDYIQVFAETRKLAAEASIEVLSFLKSGPINYDAMGRLLYHLSEDLKREISLDIHNEQLLASDEHQALRVTNETPDISADRRVLKLLRGGASGDPNPAPVVRPRYYKEYSTDGPVNKINNEIIVRVDSNPITLPGDAVDFEEGTITLPEALTSGAVVNVDYSYVTNVYLFNLNPNGIEDAKHLNKLLQLLGTVKASMGSNPRYQTPTHGLMSLNVSNLVSGAEAFEAWRDKPGNELNQSGWVAKVKGMNMIEHNEPWAAADSRILLGRPMATKYAIETNMTVEGPHPTRDASGEMNGGREVYLFTNDALKTPRKEIFSSIKLYNK